MCTVTYIPSGNNIYLTANRDEKAARSKALMPLVHHLENGRQLLFPKDPDAGGTWIGLKDNSDAAVLLNGAFVAHQTRSPYRLSRGLVLLDIISSPQPLDMFTHISLYDVEPFTVILIVSGRLFECRWDGIQKFTMELNAAGAYIWSSATLFKRKAQVAREDWFEAFLQLHPIPSQKQVLDFHRQGVIGNPLIDLQMNRDAKLKTVSITSIILSTQEDCLTYFDLERTTGVTTFFNKEKQGVIKGATHAC